MSDQPRVLRGEFVPTEIDEPDSDVIGIEEQGWAPTLPTTINVRQTAALILYLLAITLIISWTAATYPDYVQPVLGGIFLLTGILLGQE